MLIIHYYIFYFGKIYLTLAFCRWTFHHIIGRTHYHQGLLKWINDKSFEQYRGEKLEPVDTGYGTELM